MNTNFTGKGLLDTLAVSLTALLSKLMEAVFGAGVHTRLAGEITWVDVGVLLCFVLTVLVVNRVATGFIRRQVRRAEAQPESQAWRTQLWHTIGWPISLLISSWP